MKRTRGMKMLKCKEKAGRIKYQNSINGNKIISKEKQKKKPCMKRESNNKRLKK